MLVRRAHERGHADHGWLSTYHTFSFADYFDPRHMGFGDLRVVNDDRVVAGAGFPTHGHRDMEIVSVVLEGALQHRDSMGHGSVIRPGDVQLMSAGTGVMHSEFNASRTEPLRFMQLWILPARRGTAPRYEQKSFEEARRRDRLCRVASPDGQDDSLTIGQDVSIFTSLLSAGATVRHDVATGRQVWLHVARGAAEVGGVRLEEGAAVGLREPGAVDVRALADSELLLFDLVSR